MEKSKLPLRIGVGIVVLNEKNQVFVGKRKDNPGEQQIGITNDINERIKTHKQKNWKLLDKTKNFYLGQEVLDIETIIKRWLK